MRVLFSSTVGHGHVFPMVPLARACVAAGHDVRWAISADASALVEAAGLTAVEAGLAGQERLEKRDALHALVASVPPADRPAFMFPRLFGETFAPPMAADLLPIAKEWRPDLLVHEQGELAAPLVGAVLGLPTVTHSFGGAVPAAIVADAGERLAGLWADHGQQVPPYAGCFAALFLDICPPEVAAVPIDHIGRVQPLRPVSYTGAELPELPPYLGPDPRPLIYITLGTVVKQASVLSAAVSGLAELPVRLLVTVGADSDPAALGDQPAHVTVERYVPQTQALPHCAAVVSHAGSGTFLGALSEGLPQLCLPQGADQFRNAEGGVRSGAALALRPDETTAEAIAAAVSQLLDEDRFRDAALRQAAAIRAMPSPEEVVGVLDRLS